MDVPRSLRAKIRQYLDRVKEMREYLSHKPDNWGRFEADFDQSISSISKDFVNFEREHVKREEELYRFKRFFNETLRHHFLHGQYVTWSFEKPYGYPGDFKIIDEIYRNRAKGNGFNRLFDEHFLKMHAAVATRNRKEDFKKLIVDFLAKSRGAVRIMDFPSGSCRDLKELLDDSRVKMNGAVIDCYDFDRNAIEYGRNLLQQSEKANFFQKNALRLALKKNIRADIPQRYDVIYSTGLFDYLDESVASKLIANLRLLLKDGGLMAIANYRDRYSNPSIYLMEWVADWNLIYRTESEFKNLFIDAGFYEKNVALKFEKQKIMQYALARAS